MQNQQTREWDRRHAHVRADERVVVVVTAIARSECAACAECWSLVNDSERAVHAAVVENRDDLEDTRAKLICQSKDTRPY